MYSLQCVQCLLIDKQSHYVFVRDLGKILIKQCLSPLMLWVRISIRARCTTLCDKVCHWLARGRWFSQGPLVSSTNKTDGDDITEILLKVALNTITLTCLFDLHLLFYFPWNLFLFYNLSIPSLVFSELRLEVIVCFVDIGGIVDHHCLKTTSLG
jgi:hypothetical protein